MECGKPFLFNIFTFNDLHGYLVENPIQTLIIRRHIVFLVWFIKRAWAACGLKAWKETVSVYFDASILVSCETCDYVKDHVSIHVTCFHFKIAVTSFASTSSCTFYLLVH